MYKSFSVVAVCVLALSFAACANREKIGTAAAAMAPATRFGSIKRFDPRFDELVPTDAQVKKIADGFAWVEGPLWNRQEGYLLFSDIPNNAVMKWQPGQGASLFLQPSGYTGKQPFTGREPGSNGLTWDSQGRLVLCEHGDRRIARLESDGSKTTLVDRYEGKRINSPNDVIYNSKGDLYFTDPPFGLPKSFDDPGKELPFCGVYRLSKDGKLTLLTKELKAPNGIALSPDERTLYLSDADVNHAVWWAFAVKADGTLGSGRIIFDGTVYTKDRKGVPDGLKVDQHSNLFAAGPGGIYVLAPDGKLLGMIDMGGPTGNCNFGADGSSLFITSDKAVYRLKLKTKGNGFQDDAP